MQEQERLLVSQLSDAVAKTATHYQLVQTNAQRWQAAEQEVEARLAEFKGGRSNVNVVLQSQQRKAQAQIDYYRALAEYNKSTNYVDYLKGTMLANSNITLAEGPWNKKAYWDAHGRARQRDASYYMDYGYTRPRVISRGPVQPLGSGLPPSAVEELIPAPIEAPPENVPLESLPPAGPVGELPEIELNAPRRASNERPAAKRFDWSGSGAKFQWVEEAQPAAPTPAKKRKSTFQWGPVQRAAHQEAARNASGNPLR